MPYIPTNCYPRDCTLEKSNVKYEFLGTVDKCDAIDNILLNLYDNSLEKQFEINVKEGTVYNSVLNKYEEEIPELKSVLPLGEDNLINIVLPVQSGQDLSSLNFYFEDAEIYIATEGDEYYSSTKHKGYNNSVLFKIPSNRDDYFLYLYSYLIPENQVYSSNWFEVSGEFLYFKKFSSFSMFISQIDYYETKPNRTQLHQLISNNSKNNYYFSSPKTSFYGRLKGGNWSTSFTDFDQLFFDFNINASAYISNLDMTIKLMGNCNFCIEQTDEYPYPSYYTEILNMFYNSSSNEWFVSPIYYDTKGAKLIVTNSISQNDSLSFASFLNTQDEVYWDFTLIGRDYDTYFVSGYCEYNTDLGCYLLSSMQNLQGTLKLKENCYGKLNEKNINVLSNIEICEVVQTYSNSKYYYTVTSKIKDVFTIFDSSTPQYLSTYIIQIGDQILTDEEKATISFNSSKPYSFTFNSSRFLISSTSSSSKHTLNVACSIDRQMIGLDLYKDSDFLESMSAERIFYVDTKTNRINSYLNKFFLTDAISLEPQIEINKKDLFISLYSNLYILYWYHIKIFENNELIYDTKNYNAVLKFKYPYLKEQTEYRIELEVSNRNNYLQNFEFFITTENFDSDEMGGIAFFDSKTLTNQVQLSNKAIEYYVNEFQQYWKNSQNQDWMKESELFSYEEAPFLELRASVYRYDKEELSSDNYEQTMIIKNKVLEPQWANEHSYNYNYILQDYGVQNTKISQYEIFYEADYNPYGSVLSFEEINKNLIFEINEIEGKYSGKITDLQNNIEYTSSVQHYDSEVYKITLNNEIYYEIYINSDEKIITQFREFVLNKEDNSFYNNYTSYNISYNILSKLFQNVVETVALPSVKSSWIQIEEWIGTSLYGTDYSSNVLMNNEFKLNPEQIWFFDLDTKSENIDFNTERQVFINGTNFPKIGLTNVNYMSQTITTKLGYLDEDDVYIDDNGDKLYKFSQFANDGTIKILRLPNGFLIPVDINLKTSVNNRQVVGCPSDISFSWTQIGDLKKISLYNIKEGVLWH